MKHLFPILLALAVAGCTTATLTEQSENRVVVDGLGIDQGPLVIAKAQKACAAYGKRPVLLYSEREWFNFNDRRYVYDCVD